MLHWKGQGRWAARLGVLTLGLGVACGEPSGHREIDSDPEPVGLDFSQWIRERRINGRDIRMFGLQVLQDGEPIPFTVLINNGPGQSEEQTAGPDLYQIPEALIDAEGGVTVRLDNGSGYSFRFYVVEAFPGENPDDPPQFVFYQGEVSGITLTGVPTDLDIPLDGVETGSLSGRSILVDGEGTPIMFLAQGDSVLTDSDIGFVWPPLPNGPLGQMVYPFAPAGRDLVFCARFGEEENCFDGPLHLDPEEDFTFPAFFEFVGTEDDANVLISSTIVAQGPEPVAGEPFTLELTARDKDSLELRPGFLGTPRLEWSTGELRSGVCAKNAQLDTANLPFQATFTESDAGVHALSGLAADFVGNVVVGGEYGSESLNPLVRDFLPHIFFTIDIDSGASEGPRVAFNAAARRNRDDGDLLTGFSGTARLHVTDHNGNIPDGLVLIPGENISFSNGSAAFTVDFTQAGFRTLDYRIRLDYDGEESCRSRTPYIDFDNGVEPPSE